MLNFQKPLTLASFTIFILIGFYIGMKYGEQKNVSNKKSGTSDQIIKVAQLTENSDFVDRCGNIPDKAFPIKTKFDVISGPFWSPDCRYVAWSVWESGTSWLGDETKTDSSLPKKLTDRVGVFLYNDRTTKTIKVYKTVDINDTPELMGWLDRDTLEFRTANVNYIYKVSEKLLNIR